MSEAHWAYNLDGRPTGSKSTGGAEMLREEQYALIDKTAA
jgi:hypothetical protein